MNSTQNTTLLDLNFGAIHLMKAKDVLSIVDLLINKMTKECKVEDTLWMMRETLKTPAASNFGLYVLTTDEGEIVCASAYWDSKLITRWTPKKHRRKGYATEMLKKIEERYTTTYAGLPLWIVSEEKMWESNKKTGWVDCGRATVGPVIDHEERDFCPASLKSLYDDAMNRVYVKNHNEIRMRRHADGLTDLFGAPLFNLKLKC